ncbi:alkaline phosphatase family protein [Halospeciosus flavus]|uniref:alkaline phosphatase family protein n=1 Tax=Halospeciosus flavus TaxID=3032283 RepID=UPI00360CEDAC
MRRDDHADDLLRAHAEGEYVFPDYGGYCFAGVPGTALSALDAAPEDVPTLPGDVFAGVDTEGVENVVVLLVDGFGYDQWCRAEDTDYLETTLLGRLSERGTVTPLTACFPSETAAAVPTVHTGQYAAEHGQLGWWQYVPEIGARVQTLPYVTGEGEPVRQVYPDAPAPSKTLYDADSLYDDVAPEVSTSLFEPSDISGADEQTFSAGASRYVGSENAAQLAVQLRRTLEGSSGEKYCYAYFPQVDAASHREGPHAAATDAQLEAVLGALRRELLERCSTRVAERTLVVVTADHGHVDTEERTSTSEGTARSGTTSRPDRTGTRSHRSGVRGRSSYTFRTRRSRQCGRHSNATSTAGRSLARSTRNGGCSGRSWVARAVVGEVAAVATIEVGAKATGTPTSATHRTSSASTARRGCGTTTPR